MLAEAEAATHGMTVEAVHFHEVGALDSIVDIIAAALAVDYLKPARIVASPLPMGRGIIRGAAHGPLPNPPPATLGVIAAAGLATFDADIQAELVTPTGALRLRCTILKLHCKSVNSDCIRLVHLL